MHEIISKLKFRHFSAVKSLDVKMSDFYELAELENDGLIYGFMMINHALINLYDMWLFLQHSTYSNFGFLLQSNMPLHKGNCKLLRKLNSRFRPRILTKPPRIEFVLF